MTTTPTPADVLNLSLPANDANAATVRDYLLALLRDCWRYGEGFDGKRPFGNSSWEYELYTPLVKAGFVKGELDSDGYLDSIDRAAADALVARAIESLVAPTPQAEGEPLTFGAYQQGTASTAVYPGAGSHHTLPLVYCALGAAGEAGEIANKVKKVLRDDDGRITAERREQILGEVGGTLWYLSQLCAELGTGLGAVAQDNLDILASRAARGTLQGSGDDR